MAAWACTQPAGDRLYSHTIAMHARMHACSIGTQPAGDLLYWHAIDSRDQVADDNLAEAAALARL